MTSTYLRSIWPWAVVSPDDLHLISSSPDGRALITEHRRPEVLQPGPYVICRTWVHDWRNGILLFWVIEAEN